MERWYQATEKRYSVRAYSSGVSQQDMESLQKFADGIEQDDVRIVLARSNTVFAGKFMNNKIKGTDCFAAFVSKSGKSLNVGYFGELFILECVARGLGTCWLGASFRMKEALDAIELSDDEIIACITPLGYGAEPFKQRARRSITSLTGLSVQKFLQLPEWQQEAIKCARRAPSAINAQPWDFDVFDNESVSVVRISKNFGYGLIDSGIAMLHIEMGAAHLGISGDWEFEELETVFKASNAPTQVDLGDGADYTDGSY